MKKRISKKKLETELTDEVKDKITYKKYVRDTLWSILFDLGTILDPLDTGFRMLFKKISPTLWLLLIVGSAVVLCFYRKRLKQAENKKIFWLKYDFVFESAVVCLVVSIINAGIILCIRNV